MDSTLLGLNGRRSEDVPRVVVFDFDLTLTRWDTADRFFRWVLRRDPWRLAMVLIALPLLLPLFAVPSTRKWPVRFAVWVATLGRTDDALSALVKEHVDSLPEAHASVIVPVAVSHLQAHLKNGDQVVIATGCLHALASELLTRAGLGHVPLVASTLRPFFGGLVRDRHCFGANKVPMLAERGFPPPWAVAYTDHHADLPVLQLSVERYLICPTPECLARIESVLGAGSPVLAWR